MSIGWGIAGTGKFASEFAAPAINKAAGAKLVAVYSRDKTRGADFAAKHGAERSYDSLDKMLSNPDVKIVHITSPNLSHAEQVIRAAGAGKHILCEKPMAPTVEDCERMIEACRKNKVKLGVGFQNRHHPAHVEAHRLIQSGIAGEVTLATAQYSRWRNSFTDWRADPAMNGGMMTNAGIHALDLLRFLLGKEVEEVMAMTDERWSGLRVDETAIAILKFEKGPFCEVVSGLHVPHAYNNVVIYGTKARIMGINTVGISQKGELEVLGDAFNTRTVFTGSDIGTYILQVEAFMKCIEKDLEPNASGIDGLKMTRLTKAILESAQEGRSVRLKRGG